MYENGSPSYGDTPPPADQPQCDPEWLDDVACRARGRAEQAKYDIGFEADLAAARVDYDQVRNAYRGARQQAMTATQDLRHKITRLIERLRCLIRPKSIWKYLEKAFEDVVDELEKCGPPTGCAELVCEFPVSDLEQLDWDALVARIAAYQKAVDEAKATFAALVAEPGALAARVAAIELAVTEIESALAASSPAPDHNLLYARALVAQRDLDQVWAGYAQSKDFVACLCQALICWSTGLESVSVLTGAKAVAECRRERDAARCGRLRTETAQEVLAVYDRLCPSPPTDDSSDEEYESDNEYEDGGRDRGQHHHG